MIVDRRDKGLDDEHVRLAAVLVERDLKATVAESGDCSRTQRQFEVRADALDEFGMSAAGEDDDPSHVSRSLLRKVGYRAWGMR